ncbi:MAG TPA: nucleotidyltransferase family protein [Gemmatimonadales bacterium]
MLGAIILAAGASERMGHPKALLIYRGETFLSGILAVLYAAGIERRVVVLGHDADKVLQNQDLSQCIVVQSTDLAAGPIGSIRTGLAVLLNHPVEAVVVWPVDRPHVSLDTIRALVDGFRSSGRPVVVPVLGGKRGHPVLFSRTVFEELADVPDDVGARHVVHADPNRVHEVEVADPAVLEDFNTPAEYEGLVRREDQMGSE